MKAADIMKVPVIWVRPETTIADAARFIENNISAMPHSGAASCRTRSAFIKTQWARIILIFAAILAAGTARAQNVAHGKTMAQVWCSNCHRIFPEKRRSFRDVAPSFSSIAQMKSTTEASLAAFLSTTHGGMPNLTLSRQEIRDVSAYILSLRTSPQ